MSPRSDFTPISHASQGVGGNNNLGIIVVQHIQTRKIYIEKRIRPSAIIRGDIQREICIMQQCQNHPNITAILTHDLNYHNLGYGSVYMQRGELGSLDALIGRFRSHRCYLPDEGLTWKVLWDLCIGLAYLWTGQDATTVRRLAVSGQVIPMQRTWSSVIHRDIKPSNIFMTWHDPLRIDTVHYPTMLLGDFGCAVTAVDTANPSLPINDPDFAPPEFPVYSGYGDVFALALSVVCVGWVKQIPPKKNPLQGGWASEGLEMVLRKCLMCDQRARPGPRELPKCVWRGYQMWLGGRNNYGNVLPEWALQG
jgi:serine/threonine protein kinase